MYNSAGSENINYDLWVQAGYVKVTPGNVVDYDFVKADILQIIEVYDFQSTAYDRWNSSQTIIDLQNEGMECNPFGQGYGSMGAPTKEFEKLVRSWEPSLLRALLPGSYSPPKDSCPISLSSGSFFPPTSRLTKNSKPSTSERSPE